ncbi:MAG: glycosyl hydrolase [Anaerolineae bacterium]
MRSLTTTTALFGGLLLAVAIALIANAIWLSETSPAGRPTPLRPAPTAEPLVPTPLPAFQATATPRPSRSAGPALPALLPPGTDAVSRFPFGGPARGRIGVGVPIGRITDYQWDEGLPGWWLSWRVDADAPQLSRSRFVQMVRVYGDNFRPDVEVIRQTARGHPGALWLIGNEPDVAWQDNATPEQYAAVYGTLYAAIKGVDPTALVAIGGVSQPTSLRMAYLDRILAAYQAQFGTQMSVDIWNVHAFILREERDSWGVGIPPGMEINTGKLYEITDHDDLALFKQQIVDFRRWLAERGFRDTPLVVSEYGILMPESYGFPAERVAEFMVETFDFFLSASDQEIGYPADEGRLVQAFCWYSASDTVYPTPNLFDPETRAITPVGEVFRAYMGTLP